VERVRDSGRKGAHAGSGPRRLQRAQAGTAGGLRRIRSLPPLRSIYKIWPPACTCAKSPWTTNSDLPNCSNNKPAGPLCAVLISFSIMHKVNLYFSLLLLVCVACRDSSSLSPLLPAACDFESLKGDVLIPPTDSCRTAPWPQQPIIGFQGVYPDTSYFIQAVNPNDAFQIAYMKYVTLGNQSVQQVWITNLCTKRSTFVATNVGMPVRWSSKNWLLFSGPDHQLWKIKPDGDSLSQLTFEGINSSPNVSVPQTASFVMIAKALA
jgi:hypothetical protein